MSKTVKFSQISEGTYEVRVGTTLLGTVAREANRNFKALTYCTEWFATLSGETHRIPAGRSTRKDAVALLVSAYRARRAA